MAQGTLGWADIYRRLHENLDDPVAWEAMEQRVRPIAQRSIGRFGSAAVDDAIADTCAAAILGFSKARGPDTFGGFVYGHFLNARRRLVDWQPTDPVDEAALIAASVESADDPRIAILQDCLADLSERERRAVELRHFDGCSAEEIAAALDVTTGNARRILFNAMGHLRACVQRALGGQSTTPEDQEKGRTDA